MKKTKKILKMKQLLTLLFMACLGVSGAWAQATDVAPDATGMDTDALTWARNVKMGWCLGNALESSAGTWDDASGTYINVWDQNRANWETAWGNPKTTKAMLQAVKAAGFNAVRIPVLWGAHVTNEAEMTIDPAWMARVKEIVDWCLDLDMMVVVNTHHELWLEHFPVFSRQEANLRKLTALWRQIATTFRDYDGRLAFAGLNEVQVNWQAPTAENNTVMNRYNQAFVDAVRGTGGKNYYRVLVVQTYSCNPSYGMQGLEVPNDPVEGRMAVEFHYYNPYNYCSGAAGSYYYWGKAFESAGNIAPEGETALQNVFREIRKTWHEKGIAVVMGEYGVSCHYTTNGKAKQEENMKYYLKCVVSEARKNGFAAFVWDNSSFGNGSEKYGIFDRKNNMNVRTPYMLEGIQEGAETAYQEEIEEQGQQDYEGTTVWQGDQVLSWGDGLQLNIPASKFAGFDTNSRLVVTVRQNPAASYDDLQLCKGGDWSACPFVVDGNNYQGDFSPRNVYGTSSGTYIIPIAFNQATINTLKQKGLYIQGYGLYLTRVLISISGQTSIILPQASTNADAPVYNLSGQRVARPQRGHIYVVNGRKVIKN